MYVNAAQLCTCCWGAAFAECLWATNLSALQSRPSNSRVSLATAVGGIQSICLTLAAQCMGIPANIFAPSYMPVAKQGHHTVIYDLTMTSCQCDCEVAYVLWKPVSLSLVRVPNLSCAVLPKIGSLMLAFYA